MSGLRALRPWIRRGACEPVNYFSTIPPDPWTGRARLLDGRLHAARWKAEIAQSIARRNRNLAAEFPPGLAAVVIGDRPDSLLYVRRKGEACEQAGMRFRCEHLPGDVRQESVLRVLRKLNADESIHGILLQLPVPSHLSESRLLECIDPRKDVDGLHPINVGRLAMRGVWRPAFMPCAPLGCMELLWRENVQVREKSVAIIGDSNIVGMPLSWLLRDAGASSVTVLHTPGIKFLKNLFSPPGNIASESDIMKREVLLQSVRKADVVVAAVGCAEIVSAEWVKKGATVVDVGINAVPLSTSSTSAEAKNDPQDQIYELAGMGAFRVLGDVAAEEVSHVAGALTPVPGGAGPMTIAALLSNTFLGAARQMTGRQKEETS